jgi:lipid II:glycine glycyltransferase (peptidoglycan interpeptide bridge formation enzyme)
MINIKEIGKEEYSNFWSGHNLHILQSVEWGMIKKSEGWECKTIGIFEDENLIDVFSIQIKSINLLRFGYVPKTLLNKHFSELEIYFKNELKLAFVIFEFDYTKDVNLDLPYTLINYNDHIQPEQTNSVMLKKTEEELFMSLKGNYRRNIKKGIGDNLITKIYTEGEEAIDKFYNVLSEVFSNTKYLARPKSYFVKVWETLSASGKAAIITAEIGEEVYGSYFIVYDNLKSYELYGGVTRKGRDYEAGYVLKWEAIKYFNSLGRISYDHWGVSKRNDDGTYQKDELHNISSFKEGFGGEYIEFAPAKVMVLDKTKFKIFSLLKKTSNVLMKIKKALKF